MSLRRGRGPPYAELARSALLGGLPLLDPPRGELERPLVGARDASGGRDDQAAVDRATMLTESGRRSTSTAGSIAASCGRGQVARQGARIADRDASDRPAERDHGRPGVRVGHTTIVEGDSVRTGVTVIFPHEGNLWEGAGLRGSHRLNGNGELTGLEWVRESGC